MSRPLPGDWTLPRTGVRPPVSLLLSVLLVGILGACGGPPAPTLAPVPPSARLFYSNISPVRDSIRLVLRDAGAFSDFWGRATAQEASPPSPPALDFERSMAVVVGAGRMTPEDEIHVDSVGVEPERTVDGDVEDVLKVVVRTTRGCGQFRTEAFPIEIVEVRRFEGTVRFIERRDRRPACQ